MINFVLVLLALGNLYRDIKGQITERLLISLDIGCGHVDLLTIRTDFCESSHQ
jgi:hypothetical protein